MCFQTTLTYVRGGTGYAGVGVKLFIHRYIALLKRNSYFGTYLSKKYWDHFQFTDSPNPVLFPQKNGVPISSYSDLVLHKEFQYKYYEIFRLKEWIEENNLKTVFFLGCSYGHDIFYLSKLFSDITFIGIDLDTCAINYCKSLKIPAASFYNLNLNNTVALRELIAKQNLHPFGIAALSVLTFLTPYQLEKLLELFASLQTSTIFIKEQNNTSPYWDYNAFLEKKSKYVDRGTWDHPYMRIISRNNFSIYQTLLLDQRMRTGAYFYHEPWIIKANLKKKERNSPFFSQCFPRGDQV